MRHLLSRFRGVTVAQHVRNQYMLSGDRPKGLQRVIFPLTPIPKNFVPYNAAHG